MTTIRHAFPDRSPCTRQVRGVVAAMVLSVSMLLAAAGCRPASPEARLRAEVAALETAIEDRDAGGVAGFLAEDFVGPGGLDRDGARRLAALHFLRQRDVAMATGPLDVVLRGDRATVSASVALTGGAGGLLPTSGELRQVRSGWRLREGRWRMTSIDWRE